MTNTYIKFMLLCCFFCTANLLIGQSCDNGGNQYPAGTVAAPNASGAANSVLISDVNWAGEYAVISNIQAGKTYSFTSYFNLIGDYLTIRDAASNAILTEGVSMIYVDDMQGVLYTAANNNNVEVHFNLNDGACGTEDLSRNTRVTMFDCEPAKATASFDCTTNSIIVDVTDIGVPASTTISIPGTTLTQTVTSTGQYTFTPITNTTQSYDVQFSKATGCDLFEVFVFADCSSNTPGCSEAVTDGSLEGTGTWAEVSTYDDWLFGTTNTGVPIVASTFVLDGTQSAWLGGWGGSGVGEDGLLGLGGSPYVSQISQSVTLTAGNIPTLYFNAMLLACDSPSDVLTISMDGTTVLTINGGDSNCGDQNFHEYSVDLSAYADGGAHTIAFRLVEQGTQPSGPTSIFIDAISIDDCPAISCDVPTGTATYDCFTNEMTVNITTVGGPNGGPFQLSVGGAAAQTITATGNYTFTGLVSNQTYAITADDGAGCVTTIATVAATCPCMNPTGTAAYDCFNNEMDVTISTTGTPYDPINNPYVITVTGGPTVAGQAINVAGIYTFTGLTPNVTYTVTADDGAGCSVVLGSVLADCACLTPEATATYDCSNDFIALNVTNPGAPTGSFNASIDGGTPVNINSVGSYPQSSFSGLTPDQTYNMVFDDGAGCSTSIDYIYGGCRVPGPQCSDILTNGSFESGSSGWDESAKDAAGVNNMLMPIIAPQFSLDGGQSALLGGYGNSGTGTGGTGPYTSSVSKTVLTTANNNLATYFWGYWENCDGAMDNLTISVYSPFNAATATPVQVFNADTFCGDDKWHEYAVDLSTFSTGATIKIEFKLTENEANNGPSRFYVDDIMVENCPSDITCSDAYAGLAGSPVPGSAQEAGPNMYDFETDGIIASLQTIQAGTTVDYDSGSEITMVQGFTVELGATFCAFIDGCNGSGGAVNPLIETNNVNALQDAVTEPTILVFETPIEVVRSRKIVPSTNAITSERLEKEVSRSSTVTKTFFPESTKEKTVLSKRIASKKTLEKKAKNK